MLAYPQVKQPWNSTLPTLPLLPKCKNLRDVNQIHARITTTGFIRNASLIAKIISAFSSSSRTPLVEFARYLLFSQAHLHRHLILWNGVIKSCSHGQEPREAIVLFLVLLGSGVCPDRFSFSLVLKACSRLALFREGLQIHCLIEKSELGCDIFLRNCLICFYSRCGYVGIARLIFDRMPERDSISWNSMIDGYVKNGMVDLARELFDRMNNVDKNLISWNSMLNGYTRFEDGLDTARQLFDRMVERDLVSWNSMIDGYMKYGRLYDAIYLVGRMPKWDVVTWVNLINGFAKRGSINIARYLFDNMPERDLIAWNAMMSGYIYSGNYHEALLLFSEMTTESCFSPDETTLVIALSAVAELGLIDKGLSIHDYIDTNGFCLNGKLGVALIDMYSKCGSIDKAKFVFENLQQRKVDHWNAIIGGLAAHGLGEAALDLFAEMVMLSFKPDDITFIGILNACSHAGLVEEGLLCFELMRQEHNLMPKVQHYGCLVDILGRAGQLEEARKVIEEMQVEPNDVVWRALLSASKNHDNFEIGLQAARNLIELDSCCPSAYVLLSNFCASFQRWSDVNKVRRMMMEQKMRKVPGCSWIELGGSVHEFVAGDTSHSQAKEIYHLLESIDLSHSEL
ncbi:pentatricopeptide repeat-containing protein At2g45350, chloroplastic [Aristolochia californica]|uniref:pentatricopeptide repeat-containing protein At2g45350, chloroplastic n=1 Tax=Aristolochia californica TaxID=171875 RepID=UPI0035DCA48A